MRPKQCCRMDTRIFHSGAFIFLGSLLVLMNTELCQASDLASCMDDLKRVLGKPKFGKVGVELMKKNQFNGTGFVYSEMKIFHKLYTVFTLGSRTVKTAINDYVRLSDSSCDDRDTYCECFYQLIQTMNKRQSSDYFYYDSFIFYQSTKDYNHAVNSGLCGKSEYIDFKEDPLTVLSIINEKYAEYYKSSSYLENNLNPQTDFFLLDIMKVNYKLLGPSELFPTENEFKDLDGNRTKIYWLKLTGEFIVHNIPSHSVDEKSVCEDIRIILSEVNSGNFYMFYFQPILSESLNLSQKTECFQGIFNKLGDYIEIAKNNGGSHSRGSVYQHLSVPIIEISTEIDLKPILENSLVEVFQRNEIDQAYWYGDTLHELRTWDTVYDTPQEYDVSTVPGEASLGYVYSSFIFALVDKQTNLVLKTGAYLRPKTVKTSRS